MRTIEIIIDISSPGDIEQLALQTIDPYLQRSNFASLQCLAFFTMFSELEILQNWVRECFPACFQRGIVHLRKTPPRPWRG
ncbi:hypothetical protein FIBSPDRAFT_35728 [Athelia psychrophila]|uniref:Uncharacterized protein n=1 Tax=Athelia psychrophila TaxID=1759441 RepID=A0A166FRZ1_9AGAM|nr:hypothetical protein FIBSPDRAFT_35728 [Fibularhizoctonia sp. CBS 109695]